MPSIHTQPRARYSNPHSVATLVAAHNVAETGTPQQRTLLAHLRERASSGLSQFEALHLYRIASLSRRITDLRQAGVPIRREMKKDPTGRAYARYFLSQD